MLEAIIEVESRKETNIITESVLVSPLDGNFLCINRHALLQNKLFKQEKGVGVRWCKITLGANSVTDIGGVWSLRIRMW